MIMHSKPYKVENAVAITTLSQHPCYVNMKHLTSTCSHVLSLGGEARKNGLLTVQFRPTFEKMPTMPVWSWNAQTVNLTCVAESIPNATIKWK